MKPAMNDALCWKSAVKKSVNHLKSEPTLGAFFRPVASVVKNMFSKRKAMRDQSTRSKLSDPRYWASTVSWEAER